MILALAAFCLADLAVSELVLGQRNFAVLWRTDARAGSLILSAALHLAMRRPLAAWMTLRWFRLVPVGAFLAGLGLYRDGVPQVVQYAAGAVLFALAVATLDAAPRSLLRQLASPPLLSLGRWSYSLYLWQQPFFVLSCLNEPMWRAPLLTAAASAGFMNFQLLEQPGRRWLNRAWSRIERRRGSGTLVPSA